MNDDRLTEAKEVDHIKPISEGGEAFDIGNLQSLCVSCHAKKSAKEGQIRI
jgi:5-methylcytosine-specific restriction protein A